MKFIPIILLLLGFAACRKDHNDVITGTVTAQQGCLQNSRLVQIDHPENRSQSFLCDPSIAILSSAILHCGNSVIIKDIPPALAQPGTKIKFSRWKNEGLSCYSSTMAPNQIEVLDLRRFQ